MAGSRSLALALACLATLAAACGSTRGDDVGAAAEGASSPRVVAGTPAVRTLPPDDPSLKGCLADWIEGFRSLPPMVDRADLIVRARTVSTTTSSERGGLTGYRTTLRVERALKGRPSPSATVVETACPVVAGGADEWLLFLAPKLDDPGVFNVVGGIQGAFPIRAGRVAPSYRDAYLVRTYTGVGVAELERDIAAIDPIDEDASGRLRALGWNVVAMRTVSTFELPPLGAWGEAKLPPHIERPFEGYARVAAASGLDLRPYAGREVEQLAFWVERSPNDGLAPVARLVYADRRFVGGWMQVDATQVFRLDDRAHAIAASPRPLAAPTAAPNRYPAGVNVVAEYDLARATDVYVKPLMPNAKPVTAPALADLVRLLDRTLPTQPAPSRRDGYWVVGFRIDDTPLVFEYFADAGLLVQRDDGYAIIPGAAFARLIGAAP